MLTVPLPPPLNKMYRPNFGNTRGVRKTVECEVWEQEVQWTAKVLKKKVILKPTRVLMKVRLYYKTERDIDSSQKALQDCLQGYFYEDDSQISELYISKSKDNANPRLEVEVYPL